MKKMIVVGLLSGSLLLSTSTHACEQERPEQLSHVKVESLQFLNVIDISLEEKERTMNVNHEVKGSDVYIECTINDFTFVKEKVGKSHVEGQGHILLYVDGHKVDTIAKPAFIVKGLPTGKHDIKLELLQNDRQPYGLEEEFSVQVP